METPKTIYSIEEQNYNIPNQNQNVLFPIVWAEKLVQTVTFFVQHFGADKWRRVTKCNMFYTKIPLLSYTGLTKGAVKYVYAKRFSAVLLFSIYYDYLRGVSGILK